MSDLVRRLREIYDDEGLPQKAADEIEGLRADLDSLEAALRELASDSYHEHDYQMIARRALKELR